MRKLLALVVALLVLAPALALAPRAAGSRAEATHVYWTNPHADAIGRAKIDGTGVDQRFIRTRGGAPRGIAVDPAHVLAPFIYWGQGDTMGRAKINGTGVRQSFMQGFVAGCWGVAVDARYRSPRNRAHVYWSYYYWYYYGGGLGRANINGTGANYNFIPFPRASRSLLAVDRTHIYWTIRGKGTIGRARLDGTNRDRRFIRTRGHPQGVAVNAEHVYWTTNEGMIGRAKTDGTGVDRRFIRTRGHPYGVAVGAGHVYWAGGHAIGRAKVDGTNRERRFIRTRGHPIGVAVGPGSG